MFFQAREASCATNTMDFIVTARSLRSVEAGRPTENIFLLVQVPPGRRKLPVREESHFIDLSELFLTCRCMESFPRNSIDRGVTGWDWFEPAPRASAIAHASRFQSGHAAPTLQQYNNPHLFGLIY
jgi:hypothetical protein